MGVIFAAIYVSVKSENMCFYGWPQSIFNLKKSIKHIFRQVLARFEVPSWDTVNLTRQLGQVRQVLYQPWYSSTLIECISYSWHDYGIAGLHASNMKLLCECTSILLARRSGEMRTWMNELFVGDVVQSRVHGLCEYRQHPFHEANIIFSDVFVTFAPYITRRSASYFCSNMVSYPRGTPH